MVEFNYHRIKSLRETLELTLDQMARRMGAVTMQSLSSWENGVTSPTMKNVVLICNTFDIDPSFFFDEVSTHVEETRSA